MKVMKCASGYWSLIVVFGSRHVLALTTRTAELGKDMPVDTYLRSRRMSSSISAAHMIGELRAGKRTREGKRRSMAEFWVMALRARGTRVQKAVCQETVSDWFGGLADDDVMRV